MLTPRREDASAAQVVLSSLLRRVGMIAAGMVLVPIGLALLNMGIGALIGVPPIDSLVKLYCGSEYLAADANGILSSASCGFDEAALFALIGFFFVCLGTVILVLLCIYRIVLLPRSR